MVSVIIPSRNERFLQKTILDILEKAEGDIEVVPVLDGYKPPDNEMVNDSRVRYAYVSDPKGMRGAINLGVSVSNGDYIMKLDGHCMLDKGFDVKLVADCEDDWIVIPRRKRLDAENWCLKDVGKPDIDYNYLSFPDNPGDFGGAGLNGRIWTKKILEKTDPKYDIDDELSFQGSAWFMKKSYFEFLELMDEKNWGAFWNEAQELSFKAWLSGGRVKRNKKTWYAHLHKGKKYGRGYKMDDSWAVKGATQANRWLYTDKMWHKQIHSLSWLINKFMPLPTWPKDWKKQIQPIRTLQHIRDKYNIMSDERFIKLPGKRDSLSKLFVELGLNKGVEVGVEQGKFSESLCKRNPDIELYAVDAWSVYKGYREHVSQDKLDGFYEAVKKRLKPYNCTVIKGFSLDVAKTFEDGSLDFVYIDGNHEFTQVVQDVAAWEKKVKKGGIVAGHDYRRGDSSWICHVKDVIQAWTYSHGIKPYFIFEDEKSPSWFWIKV